METAVVGPPGLGDTGVGPLAPACQRRDPVVVASTPCSKVPVKGVRWHFLLVLCVMPATRGHRER